MPNEGHTAPARALLVTPWIPVALIGSDLIALVAAGALAVALVEVRPLAQATPRFVTPAGLFMAIIWVLTMWMFGLYRRRIDLSVVATWPSIARAVCLASMFVMFVAAIVGEHVVLPAPLGFGTFAVAWALSLLTVPAARVCVRGVQKTVRRHGVSEKRTLIIGAGQVGTLLAEKMLRSPELGLHPVAFWDPEPPENEHRDELGLPVYRSEADLDEVIVRERINHVLVAFTSASFHETVARIEQCCEHAVEITIVPRLFEITATDPRMDEIEGVPVTRIRRRGFGGTGAVIKRTFDMAVATFVVVMLSPLLAGVALAVWADSGRPVIFRQKRIGRGLRPFTMYKFRSMVVTAEQDKAALLGRNELAGPLFKIGDDPRITKVGRWMRRYSLDELPQLFNVLKGDMSLVGPRPPLPDEVEQYTEWQLKRLAVSPGITGLWQILGRTELSFEEMVSLDLNYAWNWSLWLDFTILARTLGAVAHGKGAC